MVCRILAGLVSLALSMPTSAGFEQDFTGQTLRVDYVHTGTAGEEHFAHRATRVEGPWPGSRTQLLDTTNLGPYMVEVADAATHRLLYTRGFASIYGEWETTGEAAGGVWRAIEEAVRVPEPRRPFQLRIRKRQPDQTFREVWAQTIDPSSRFVDRAPAGRGDVLDLEVNGDPSVKVDLVILGDGYTAEQMGKFDSDAKRAMEALFAEQPFARHRRDFNVRAVRTPATHTGISRPRAGVFRDSPLGARYNSFDSERYILTLEDWRWRDAAAAAPYDFVLILVNERKYGGGGLFRLYSTAAADSGFADYLVVHEFGHHFAALADEYYTSPVAYEESRGERTEPWEPNVTALHDPEQLKWAHLVDGDTLRPTPWDKETYDRESLARQKIRRELRAAGAPEEELEALFREEQELFTKMLAEGPHGGKVGAFEGAMYEAQGLYRPAADCLMFTRDDVGFCAVCHEALERVIALYTK